jgi:hypothetical protein
MTPNRRKVLMLLGAAAPLALAACSATSTTSGSTVAAQVVSDIGLIGSGLSGALPGLVSAGLPAANIASVTSLVNNIVQTAAGVSTSLSTTAAQPAINQIIGVVGQIAAIAGPALPPPWGEALTAAEILLPVVAAAVGLVLPSAAAGAAAMSPDQARLILTSMSKH